ncbi:EAL domain-containing protein [Cycloclasticus pugetii]|uniref:bifunctional diguanylate cyclase/phosphodiesterase n=1 Tax=Cycloclasticus pugetii TaxID=34068 RepID=UPI003A94AF48
MLGNQIAFSQVSSLNNNKNSNVQPPLDSSTASQVTHAAGSGWQSTGAGFLLIAVAGLLLTGLMVWQAAQDYRLLRLQHQIQVEESVWLTASQIALNLEVKSAALSQLLDQMYEKSPEAALQAVEALLPGLRNLTQVSPQIPYLQDTAPTWMPSVRGLSVSGQAFAIDSDPRSGSLLWVVDSRRPGYAWVLEVDDRDISGLVSAQPAQGYVWLLEDAGHARVLARQQEGSLVYLDNKAMTAQERSQVVVSAPVAGSLWQVRGLVEPDYYVQQLGQVIRFKVLVVVGFVAVLLLVAWILARMRRANRRLLASNYASSRAVEDTERRYQDVFQGVGIALCQLNLAGLRDRLIREGITSRETLDAWLEKHPAEHSELLECVTVVDANQVTLDLLALDSMRGLERMLHRPDRIRRDTARYRLIQAVLERQPRLEMETPLRSSTGAARYVWVIMRLPERVEDYHAVTMSISDITSRRRVELSMVERERFWAGVVKAVPDIVFIKDMPRQKFVYSNRSLAQMLGYADDDPQVQAEDYRDRLLHPDDLESMLINRNLQQVLPDEKVQEARLRWRHRDGSWHWFSLRVKVLSRLPDGRVKQLIGVIRDVTVQSESTEQLKTSEQRYRLLAENISDVIWSTDSSFHLNYISPSVKPLLGYEPDDLIRRGFTDIVAGDEYSRFMGQVLKYLAPLVGVPEEAASLQKEGFYREITFDCITAEGRKCPTELRLSLMWGAQGEFLGLLGIARDITEQRRTENRLRMAATVFENTTGAILVTDPAGYVVQVNENFSQITGFSAEEILDHTPRLLESSVHDERFYPGILRTLREQGRWEGEIWLRRKCGEQFPAWTGITAVQDNEGDLVSYVCFFVDISERKASEARIESLAYYDALTGLANRTLFQDRLRTALQLAERREEWVAVLFLDLDRFKPINDTLGHAAGDAMLKEVARRLRECVRDSDTVARMGGDEFTMLLGGLTDREAAMGAGIHVAEKILTALAPAFCLQEREFFISASIGLALYPQDGLEVSSLLKNADTAMYHAKGAGKDTFQFYQADMNARALERLSLEGDLRRALQDDVLTLHYQPQFDCASRRLTGAEALLRWQHPVHGAISPAVFIPMAEEIGLVGVLGEWVIDRACRQMAEWRDAGHHLPRLAINLSARQFTEGRLAEQVGKVLKRYAIDPVTIELELTESVLLHDVEETMQTLAALKQLGVEIAVDDFGTGYSSLNYLKDFPIDTLKIDRSFIQAMHAGNRDTRLAKAIVALGRSLQLRVIAEGVETLEQLGLLVGFGCDEVQGYLLGRPVPADTLLADHLLPRMSAD